MAYQPRAASGDYASLISSSSCFGCFHHMSGSCRLDWLLVVSARAVRTPYRIVSFTRSFALVAAHCRYTLLMAPVADVSCA